MSPQPLPQAIADALRQSGAAHWAVTAVAEVEPHEQLRYARWLEQGCNAGMDYLRRYQQVRNHPAELLPGAQSMICCAFPYAADAEAQSPIIAEYALGDDYHDVLRRHLTEVAAVIEQTLGGTTRICIDTAPLRERYWAERAGLGVRGRHSMLIVPGLGTRFFLAEIITTAAIEPCSSAPAMTSCGDCGRCLDACPTHALQSDGSVDARRCLSYLTIEHRGDFPPGTDLHGRLYGCDACARACPHNSHVAPTEIAEFAPRPDVVGLTAERAARLTQEEFSTIFRRSAIKRAKLAGLLRNARGN